VVLVAVEVLVQWLLGLQEQQVKVLLAALLLDMQAIQQHPAVVAVDLLQSEPTGRAEQAVLAVAAQLLLYQDQVLYMPEAVAAVDIVLEAPQLAVVVQEEALTATVPAEL
jgi:hypothetical protein